MSAAEQGAWVAVWVTAIVGILAATGSFLAAWAAQKAARVAIRIATEDRIERQSAKEAGDAALNWRAALRLQPSIRQLVQIAEEAIDVLEMGQEAFDDQQMRPPEMRDVRFNTDELSYSPEDLHGIDMARIGALDQLADGVSGSLGTEMLLALALSRESAVLVDRVVRRTQILKVAGFPIEYMVESGISSALAGKQGVALRGTGLGRNRKNIPKTIPKSPSTPEHR